MTKRARTAALWSALVGMAVLAMAALLWAAASLTLERYRWRRANVVVLGDNIFRFDPDLGFVITPGVATSRHHADSGLHYDVFADSRGARRARPGEPPLAAADIVAIGGSFTWGQGVEADETYVALASRSLGLSAVNLAVPSYGTVGAMELLRRNLDLSPRLVIYGFIADHVRRNLKPCAPSYSPFCRHVPVVFLDDQGAASIRPPPIEAKRDSERNRRYAQLEAEALLPRLRLGLELLLHKARWRLAPERRWAAEPWRREASMRFVIEELHQLCRSVGAKLAVVHIPRPGSEWPGKPPPAELMDALQPSILLIDVRERLASAPAIPIGLPRDGHPNADYHRLIAEQVVRRLRAGSPAVERR